ncbi:unnamed protein product [Rotaria sordida]|uniref:Uncharacterized protein n=1 Tax=Rotaria sordida TaxID=392033 RepID=A0A814ERX5_9BILA|nr:unnamed protein product [Rotaria sordida]
MQLVNTIDAIGSPIRHMIISTDDTFIVIACDDASVQVKSLVTGSDIHNLEAQIAMTPRCLKTACTRIAFVAQQ